MSFQFISMYACDVIGSELMRLTPTRIRARTQVAANPDEGEMPTETASSFSEKHADLHDFNEDVAAYLRNCRAYQVCTKEAYLRGGGRKRVIVRVSREGFPELGMFVAVTN